MAGIKIHNYPIERTSFGDDDYYDIDYWTGTAYETAKIKGSVLKSALGYSFVDIQAFISGYTLSANDAGKVITNSNTGAVRSLVINNTLSGAGNSFHVKGRVAIQPLTGVNIDLPDGSTITEPTQYTCEADTHYVLHRKASTGNDWVLSAINKDTLTNLGLSDLEQMDLVRVFEVFENGELKFITNHANSDAIFRIGENSEERFGEITLNSETFNQTVAVQNPTNDGQGIITRVNPNEFDVDSRDDISDVGTRRNRLYLNPQATTLEFTESGRLILRNNGVPENIFEDLSPTKKGLQYNADYSADYTDRSLVDKAFVLNNASNIGNTNLSIPSTTNRTLTIPSDSTLDFGALMKLYGTGSVDFTSDVTVDNVQFKGGVGTQGEMSWSADEETVKLIMDGTTLYVGQDTFVHVRNNTASIITKGTAVYATGTLGASGRITVAPMIADGTIPGRLFIGLAAENIAIGADGQVITFGKIRQIDTTAYNDGDVLWLSPTIAGSLTATEPAAPNLKIATAFVIHDASNGTLMVRAEQGNDLHSDQRVQVSGLTNNDVLTWNNANQRWQNAQPDGGAQIYTGTNPTPLTKRAKIRFTDFLGAVDDAINSETVVSLDTNITKDVNPARFGANSLDEVDLLIPHERIVIGDSSGFATNMTGSVGNLIGFKEDNKVREFEAVEAFNILKETGITANKQLALIGIDAVASNVKATFMIDNIMLINTTANSVTINVGSTSGGTDVVNALVVGANATVIGPLGTRFFSNTAGQNLFISSSSWSSANLTISVTVKKVHYV